MIPTSLWAVFVCLGFALAALAGPAGTESPTYTRAVALFDQGKFQAACNAFTKVLAEEPSNDRVYHERARCWTRLDNLDRAMADYNKSIELNPRNASTLSARGALKQRCKDTAGALADLDRALELAPGNAAAYANRGMVRSALGDYPGAIQDATRSIELNPKQSMAYYNRGVAKARSEDAPGAIADYTRAIEHDAKNADAYVNRANLYVKTGDTEAARSDFQKVVALEPANTVAAAQLKKFESDTVVRAERPVRVPGASAPVVSDRAVSVSVTPQKDVVVVSGGKFPTDPYQAAALPTEGMPWQKASVTKALPPLELPAVTLAPLLDFKKMSELQYKGAVSVAMEGMRILYGEMTPEEEKEFQDNWAPLFDFISPATVDYLNQLNPLLGQYLVGREAFMRASAAYQAAMNDAALAVAADSSAGYLDALAMGDCQAQILRSLQAGLMQLADQIQALGNPPNPFAAKCEARSRYRHALTGDSWLDGEWVTDGGGRWYFKTIKRYPDGMFLVYQYSFAFADMLEKNGLDASKPGLQNTKDGKTVTVPGLDDMLRLCQEQPGGMLLSGPVVFGVTLDGHFRDGERVHYIRYTTGIQGTWTFSGTTLYRAPLTQATPPVLPGATWEGVMAVATKYESNRIQSLKDLKRLYPTQLGALIDVDPDNLPVPPKVRQPWEEGPYKIGDPRREAWLKGELPDSTTPKKKAAPKKAPPYAETGLADAVKDTIKMHESVIKLLQYNIQREQEELDRESDLERRAKLALRIVQLDSDVSDERDMIASYKTGTIVHTRSAYDEYVHDKFIQSIRVKAADVDITRRIAVEVERQIEGLPEEMRWPMRQKAHKILDARSLASGDVEKACKLANSLGGMTRGYKEGEEARQEEQSINSEENKFIANMALMTVGTVFVGLGSQALMESFGEQAAITLWGPHIIGGVYGGVTGLMTGGPVEGVKQSVAWAAPIGAAAVEFVEGYRHGVDNPNAAWTEKLWAGAKAAGTAYIMGKSFQYGAKFVGKGALHFLGEDSALFKPIFRSRNVQQAFSAAKFNQQVQDAESLVNYYKEKQLAFAKIRTKYPAGSPEVTAAELELKQLSASLNSSYHCKWLLKYKTHPSVQRSFSQYVDQSYKEMTPELYKALKAQGYDTTNLKFKPIRNPSSAGSASMDLDLALQETPGMRILKNGKPVKMAEFQKDAQKAVNEAYHSVTKYSATRSEVNLTTSVHGESFSSKGLLKKNVNFNDLKPGEAESIGKVLTVKTRKIEGDTSLDEFTKLQGRCRESSKEIDNMLLKKLRQKLEVTPPGSSEARQIKADLDYWTKMSAKFKAVGTQSTNPYEMLEMDRALRGMTGGKGFHEVEFDLTLEFGK